jgi:acyl-coenzyme A thioesterase PaaI-like protein
LAVEFKINLLAPARSPIFQARARVIRKGRTLTIAIAEVFGMNDDSEELVATMIQTVFVRNALSKPG